MNLDAIILFYKKIDRLDYNEKDILLMSSAIMNGNIDINLSVRDNMLKYHELDESFNPDTYLSKSDRNCDIPIYRVLLQDSDFFDILVNATNKGLINSESFRDMIECYLDAVDKVTDNDNDRVMVNVIKLLSLKLNVSKEVMQDSQIIREFIKNNLFALGMPKRKKNRNDVVSKKMIIIKLFRLGFVKFGLSNDVLLTYQEVLQPLLDVCNYGQVKLVIYRDNVPCEDIDFVQDYINRAIDANYEKAIPEDREYGEKCKEDIELAFNLRRENSCYKLRNV